MLICNCIVLIPQQRGWISDHLALKADKTLLREDGPQTLHKPRFAVVFRNWNDKTIIWLVNENFCNEVNLLKAFRLNCPVSSK